MIYFYTCAHHELSLLLITRKQISTAAASDLNPADLLLQDVADGVSDVKMMHDDISVGMKDLNMFVSDSMTQVMFLMVVMVCCTSCVF